MANQYSVTKEEMKRVKVEFNRPSFKEALRQIKGNECYCCGTTENLEFHHILAISKGGTNRITNIIPICHTCHALVHDKTPKVDKNKGGRKKIKPPKGYKDMLDRYFNCEIGKKECQELIGYTGNKINDAWWYRDYIKECGIKRFRNNIDIIFANGVMCEGRIVGEIVYNNGEVQFMYSDAYIQSHKEYEQMSFV